MIGALIESAISQQADYGLAAAGINSAGGRGWR